MKIFLIFLISLNTLFCDYPYRDIKKPVFHLNENAQIIQLSTARTGSTLIYNILNYLFEEHNYHIDSEEKINVLKLHSLFDWKQPDKTEEFGKTDVFLVQTIREPLNIVTSHFLKDKFRIYRVCNPMDELPLIERAEAYNFHHLCLKYENFDNDNFNYIFEEIEHFFSITIPKEEKKKIESYFCKKTMKSITKKYTSFKQVDPFTSIHGNHMNNADFRSVLSFAFASYVYKTNQALRKQWGYPDLDLKKIYGVR